jgi:transposase
MAWFRVVLSDDEQRLVLEDRESHPHPRVRRRMLVLWLLHCGLTRVKAAQVAGVSRATVERVMAAFRDGGLEAVRQWNVVGPTSELAASADLIRDALEKQPPRTVAEAAERIESLTGMRRSPTQVRKLLKRLGFRWQRTRAIPLPPKKVSRNMSPPNRSFCRTS